MGHNLSQDHTHSHDYGKIFLLTIILNSVFVITEFSYGFIANSTALMADAGHNLSDVLGLLLAWGAVLLAKKTPKERYTYGLRSSTILAALANAIFLLVVCGGIAWEAIGRFSTTPPVVGLTMILVASIGIVINSLSAWLFARGNKNDLNIRGAYLHMAADAAVSLGVVVAGILMIFTDWYWLDPVITLIIIAVIMIGTWSLLRESIQLALFAVPSHIDMATVADYLRQLPGVTGIHDLHIWGMSTTESALTVHLIMPNGYPGDVFMDDVSQSLKLRFSIVHCTFQVEQGNINHACVLHQDVPNNH